MKFELFFGIWFLLSEKFGKSIFLEDNFLLILLTVNIACIKNVPLQKLFSKQKFGEDTNNLKKLLLGFATVQSVVQE